MNVNRKARPYWTYVKAIINRLSGSDNVPANHENIIIQAYNRGITWWNGTATIKFNFLFDYSQDNSPT
jgi:hypothetical protein